MKRVLFFLTIGCTLMLTAPCYASKDEKAWGSVINLAEALIGEGSFLDAEGAEGKLDALIDLHVAFCSEVTGKRISSQRIMATKQGMRLFLKTAGERYQGDKRKAILRLLRDLATNRAVFIEILTSDSPSEVIEQQMMAYLERNQGMTYKEPVAIPEQISVIQADTPLKIVVEGIRLVSDSGTSGHYNMAIDAGEVITLNIPLKNISDDPFRSTSGFLQTEDRYVRVGNSEVLYTERSEIDGQTVTFAPGKSITPSQHFVFTLSPDCPDGHKVDFTLLAWDSDRGKHEIPFEVTVYHVGPLDFGSSRIDDDIPGPSNGNGNGVLEPGETIEYVLSLQNKGNVLVENISANLFSSSPRVTFEPGDDSLKYKQVEPNMEQPISSSFVFALAQDNPKSYAIKIKKMIKEQELGINSNASPNVKFHIALYGKSRDHSYSWIQPSLYNTGVSDDFYDNILKVASKEIESVNSKNAIRLLSHSIIQYRVNNDNNASLLFNKAKQQVQSNVKKRKLLCQTPILEICETGLSLPFDLKKNLEIQGLDGQNYSFQIQIKLKTDRSRETKIKSAYIYTQYKEPAQLEFRCGDMTETVDVGKFIRTERKSKSRYPHRNLDGRIPGNYIACDESGYVDLNSLRFIYNASGKYLKINIYRLDIDKSYVPTSIPAISQEDYKRIEKAKEEKNRLKKISKYIYHKGIELYNQEEYQAAILEFSEAIKNNNENSDAYYWRAISYYELKRYENAKKDLETLYKLEPDDYRAVRRLGWIYYKKRDYSNSIKYFSISLSKKPKDGNAYKGRGWAKYSLKKYKEALEDFNKSIEIDKTSSDAYSGRAQVYVKLKMPYQAEADVDSAKKLGRNVSSWVTKEIEMLKLN